MDANLRYLVDSVRDAMTVFHYPSAPGSHRCGGCGEPIRRADGAWRSDLTDSGRELMGGM